MPRASPFAPTTTPVAGYSSTPLCSTSGDATVEVEVLPRSNDLAELRRNHRATHVIRAERDEIFAAPTSARLDEFVTTYLALVRPVAQA